MYTVQKTEKLVILVDNKFHKVHQLREFSVDAGLFWYRALAWTPGHYALEGPVPIGVSANQRTTAIALKIYIRDVG